MARVKMEMNIGYLKKLLKECQLPDDTPVFVGCQGYTNYDFKAQMPYPDTDTFVIVHEGKLFITDNCAIETATGETI